jgi:hypothetical protein
MSISNEGVAALLAEWTAAERDVAASGPQHCSRVVNGIAFSRCGERGCLWRRAS